MSVGLAKPSAAQRRYWNEKLKTYRLGMERGRSHLLEYGHRVKDLDTDGRKLYPNPGDGTEYDEWPRSII